MNSRLCKVPYNSLRRYLQVIVIVGSVFGPLSPFEVLASAQSSATSKAKKKRKKNSKPSKSKESSGSEASYSSGGSLTGGSRAKKGKFILGHAGLSPQPLIGFGGAAGLVNPSGTTLEASVTISSGKKEYVAARIIHLGARYRVPMFSFAYAGGGLGFRMASGAWNVLSIGGSEYETTSSLNAVTIDGAVGAQKKFGSFIVGADLVGISFPLFKLGVKKSALQESDVDLEDEKKQQATFDSLAAGMHLTLLKVGVGLSF